MKLVEYLKCLVVDFVHIKKNTWRYVHFSKYGLKVEWFVEF